MTLQRLLTAGTLAAAAAALLAGCVIAPPRPYPVAYGYPQQTYGDPYEGVVGVAPPPQQREVVGVAPAYGYIWIGGFWNWVGGRHVWAGGRWEAPRPGYRWAPHRWEPVANGWRQRPGHWER